MLFTLRQAEPEGALCLLACGSPGGKVRKESFAAQKCRTRCTRRRVQHENRKAPALPRRRSVQRARSSLRPVRRKLFFHSVFRSAKPGPGAVPLAGSAEGAQPLAPCHAETVFSWRIPQRKTGSRGCAPGGECRGRVALCYAMGSKSAAPCLQRGQMKSSGRTSPS